MKKGFLIVVFMLSVTALFAQHTVLLNADISTSEGIYSVAMWYEGRNIGQQLANEQANNPKTSSAPSLSNGQSQAIWNALNRYQHRTGDTYLFALILNNNPNSRNNVAIAVIVQMNSNGGFSYWAYSLGLI
jgi:hypothetical protein